MQQRRRAHTIADCVRWVGSWRRWSLTLFGSWALTAVMARVGAHDPRSCALGCVTAKVGAHLCPGRDARNRPGMTGEYAPPLCPLTGHLRCRLGSMSDSLYGNSRSVICKPDRRLPQPASTTVSRGLRRLASARREHEPTRQPRPTRGSGGCGQHATAERVVQNLGRLSAPLLRRRTERLSARPRGWEVEWPTGRSRLEWPAGRLRVEWPARRSRVERPTGRPRGERLAQRPRDRETEGRRDGGTEGRRDGGTEYPLTERVPQQCRDDHRGALGAPEQRAQRIKPLPRADRAGSRGRRGDLLGGRVVETPGTPHRRPLAPLPRRTSPHPETEMPRDHGAEPTLEPAGG
jgi:hypothetical protein